MVAIICVYVISVRVRTALSFGEHAVPFKLGLQRYTELVEYLRYGPDEPAYHIASRIFARFTNFLEPVIDLARIHLYRDISSKLGTG